MGQQEGAERMMARGERVSNAGLAQAAGFLVLEPGARGRTLHYADGNWYGTALPPSSTSRPPSVSCAPTRS
jgi:hypothetical protein